MMTITMDFGIRDARRRSFGPGWTVEFWPTPSRTIVVACVTEDGTITDLKAYGRKED